MNDDNDRPKLPTLVSGGVIRGIIPQSFDEAWRIANAVVVAGMAPYGLNTPEKATIAILHGLEVGMAPMNALQSIAVINGRPCIYGDGALGLVQGSGKMQTYKEWIEGEDDARVAYCRVVRKGDPRAEDRQVLGQGRQDRQAMDEEEPQGRGHAVGHLPGTHADHAGKGMGAACWLRRRA